MTEYNESFCHAWQNRQETLSMKFELHSNYQPRGDQPAAIDQLSSGVASGDKHQVLLGVTGSGKTFTMAKLMEQFNRPSLVLAHNKTLAAQLYHEFKAFFPENAVEYFVSYYDYYQPEAYVPRSEEHTSELQSRLHLVCRLLLEKKKHLARRRLD